MLKMIWNKADCTLELGNIRITAAPQSAQPFTCQGIVEEQDTYLLLGEQTDLRDPGKPAWYLANTLENDSLPLLGEIIVKGRSPYRLLAVVHDVEQDPTLDPHSISLAYQSLLDLCGKLQLTSLATPLLGTVHGKMSEQESFQRLCASLEQGASSGIQQIWIMLPENSDCRLLNL